MVADEWRAFAGALLYILMHGVAKGGLFLCAGNVEHATHTKDITKLGGLFRTMPGYHPAGKTRKTRCHNRLSFSFNKLLGQNF